MASTPLGTHPAAQLRGALADGTWRKAARIASIAVTVVDDFEQELSFVLAQMDRRSIRGRMPTDVRETLADHLDDFVLHRRRD
ncbi:MAG TPA: hypothetical protein VIQ62_08260, partial [Burkholderiales bacterium]